MQKLKGNIWFPVFFLPADHDALFMNKLIYFNTKTT